MLRASFTLRARLSPSLADHCHHVTTLMTVIPNPNSAPANIAFVESKLPLDTQEFLQTIYPSNGLTGFIQENSRLFEVLFAGKHQTGGEFNMRKRRPMNTLEFFIRYLFLENNLGWVRIREFAPQFERLLRKGESFVQFCRRDDSFIVSDDNEYVCLGSWWSQNGRPSAPILYPTCGEKLDVGFDISIEDLPSEIADMLEQEENIHFPWFNIETVARGLSETALEELQEMKVTSLKNFLKAFPDRYELSEDEQNVRSVPFAHYLQWVHNQQSNSFTPFFKYVPNHWVPVTAITNAMSDTDKLYFKKRGGVNDLISLTSGVSIRMYQGKLRATPFYIARRFVVNPDHEPCIATYNEYRIPRHVLEAIDQHLSTTKFLHLDALFDCLSPSIQNDIENIRWPLDIFLSFYPTTFEIKPNIGVRSRREEPECHSTRFRFTAKFELPESIERITRSLSFRQKKRVARSTLRNKENLSLGLEQMRDLLLAALPEDDTPVSVNLLRSRISYPNFTALLRVHGGFLNIFNAFPKEFHLVVSDDNHTRPFVRRGHGLDPPDDDNPYFNPDTLITKICQIIKSRNHSDPMYGQVLRLRLPWQAQVAVHKCYGSLLKFLKNRPDVFEVTHDHHNKQLWSVRLLT